MIVFEIHSVQNRWVAILPGLPGDPDDAIGIGAHRGGQMLTLIVLGKLLFVAESAARVDGPPVEIVVAIAEGAVDDPEPALPRHADRDAGDALLVVRQLDRLLPFAVAVG